MTSFSLPQVSFGPSIFACKGSTVKGFGDFFPLELLRMREKMHTCSKPSAPSIVVYETVPFGNDNARARCTQPRCSFFSITSMPNKKKHVAVEGENKLSFEGTAQTEIVDLWAPSAMARPVEKSNGKGLNKIHEEKLLHDWTNFKLCIHATRQHCNNVHGISSIATMRMAWIRMLGNMRLLQRCLGLLFGQGSGEVSNKPARAAKKTWQRKSQGRLCFVHTNFLHEDSLHGWTTGESNKLHLLGFPFLAIVRCLVI